MTNEEKAKELAQYYSGESDYKETVGYDCAIAIAEWKDKQAIEYLYKNIQSLLKDYGVSEASADLATKLFLANFKKAMEE